MKILLRLNYRTPNPRNKRQHWTETMREKHRAQDALLFALRSAASDYSTQMPNTAHSRICSTASTTLDSYAATGRIRSSSNALRKKSAATKPKKRSSK